MSDKRMNLYVVTNGWTGESYVRVYVVAATEARALELAGASFREQEERPRYWQNLYIDLLHTFDGSELVTAASDEGWEVKGDDLDTNN